MKRKDTTEKSPRKKLPPKRIWVNWYDNSELGYAHTSLESANKGKMDEGKTFQYRLVEPRRKGKRK